jgi:diaminohydroxyphosphoribosylaminopyrimidine deaminase / 5-amino-6-(5-phosphoribosylamino)uracil reductase
VGIETALADDPMLDCRLPGLEDRSPVRVVLDSSLRLPLQLKLAQTASRIPMIVFTSAPEGGDELAKLGNEIVRVRRNLSNRLDLTEALAALAERGITRLLVEGGATTTPSFLSAGYADRIEVFTAPQSLGEGAAGDVIALTDAAKSSRFRQTGSRKLGPDLLESYAAIP